ncbi:MAG TPA: aldehyde dehydrogenase [Stellaceae bacterium]|jgi:acyl-CoA reductase-like NAD-dependent aldehyde dehydrogenase|nr:aldehyde dehydrogenase [Stellaceae bacterium]
MTAQSQDSRTTIAGVDVSTAHWIGGRRIPSNRTFEDFSPIDGRHLANVSAGGADEADAAVAAARRAFPAWAALGPAGRLPILKRFAEGILARKDQLAAVETMDNGSLLVGNRERMVPRAAHNIEFFAEWAMRRHEPIDSPAVTNHIRYDPSGVAVLITPWNGPFMLTTWKVGPALAAGNTIVVKPPEWAPLTCSLMADIAHEAGVPAGVFNLVQGIGEEAGAALVAHPDIDRISFTGSTDTARLIGAAAARTITPVSFELGGKSPFVVFADADLDAAAKTIAGQYNNAGQVCLAGTRILVENSIADDLLARVRAEVGKITVGDPRQAGTRIGPLIHPDAFQRVTGFVDRALIDGAKPLWGGKKHAFGDLYFEPTLLTDVRQEMEVVRREVFGPVLTWQTFRDESDVVELANGTKYGLAAMVFTRSEERAWRVSDQLTAGSLWVNCFFVRDLRAPFGGARNSGIGREGGDWSMDFYCDVKNVSILKGSFA